MAKKKKTRAKYDWEAIEQEYRTGRFSNREISRRHGVPESSLRRRANEERWTKDLTSRVKQKVKDNLLRNSGACTTDDEIVDVAGRQGADVIRSHREDITRLRQLESEIIGELLDGPTKLYLSTYKGNIVQKVVSLTAAEKAQAANNLANVQHKRIQLERQAFNLNDGEGDIENPLSSLLKKIDKGGLPGNDC